jgi:hypothetical protein
VYIRLWRYVPLSGAILHFGFSLMKQVESRSGLDSQLLPKQCGFYAILRKDVECRIGSNSNEFYLGFSLMLATLLLLTPRRAPCICSSSGFVASLRCLTEPAISCHWGHYGCYLACLLFTGSHLRRADHTVHLIEHS